MRDFHFPGRSAVHAQNGMVATSHPLASQCALQVLKDGGNAIDASIAAAAVLAVVEPQMTGIGGDCFVLYSPKGSSAVKAYNGSGRSPAAATLAHYQEKGLTKIDTHSIDSVTLPGAIEAWSTLHADHGSKDFGSLFQPAIGYARNGFPVHGRVYYDWREVEPLLRSRDALGSVFMPGGKPAKEGDIIRQEKLAGTLQAIAEKGASAFYEGPIAEAMVETLRGHGGVHTLEDFAAVKGNYVTPASTNYRGYDVHQVPPNNQGITALLMLNILEGFGIKDLDPVSADRMHLEIEAGRIAYLMRDLHLADLDSMTVAMDKLLSKSWADELRQKISLDRAMTDIGDLGLKTSDTVYLTVVDKDLNAVSFINSVYHSFGSGFLCPKTGVVFQNRGSSFNVNPDHPNCIGPNKRPMHTIMPGMMTKGDKVAMSFGVMGGDYQPYGQIRVVSNVVDFGIDVQAAIDMPRVFSRGSVVDVERSIPAAVLQGLSAKGHALKLAGTALGGGQAIYIDHDRGVLTGGSDPRKDGLAIGF